MSRKKRRRKKKSVRGGAEIKINSHLKIKAMFETFAIIRAKQLELVNRKPLSDANLKEQSYLTYDQTI